MVMIGILPTLFDSHMTPESLSTNPRYALLDQQILLARGEDLQSTSAAAPSRSRRTPDSIIPEAACTSLQFHLQVSPDEFAQHWNAAQCLASVQVALGANSPFLRPSPVERDPYRAVHPGRRHAPGRAQGAGRASARLVRRAVDHERVRSLRGEPQLLPRAPAGPRRRGPGRGLRAAGGTPSLHELRLHNGTVWRWNRPVYDITAGRPHLRVENRVLPAGPTVVDILANGALYFGALKASPGRTARSGPDAVRDGRGELRVGRHAGIDASVFWPGIGDVPVTELVLRRLLPLAHEGLRRGASTTASANGCWASSRAGARPDATARRGRWTPYAGSRRRACRARRRCDA